MKLFSNRCLSVACGVCCLIPFSAIPAINVDLGRQLFVDDYLVESTTGLHRSYHHPEKFVGNPVLRPETPFERAEGKMPAEAPCSVAIGGGLWWDPHKRVFRLWYESGWMNQLSYAESADGVNWVRPKLDVVPGTNLILPDCTVDSWSVWPDYSASDPYSNWKLMVSIEGGVSDKLLYTSNDGIHWKFVGEAGAAGDRSTMFYNPFRGKWTYSLRSNRVCRDRAFFETDDFENGSHWRWPWNKEGWRAEMESPVNRDAPYAQAWLEPDELDVQDDDPQLNRKASLYNFDAAPYESIMVGLFQLHWGPENDVCRDRGLPKITDLQFAYSRDGFNFSRPDRTAAIRSERWGSGKWDTGYVQPLSSICVIKDEKLWFYYNGMKGDPSKKSANMPKQWHNRHAGMHFHGAIGVATLRRDGFAGMVADGNGELVTKTLDFSGRRLFVNGNFAQGSIKAEIIGENGELLKTLPAATGDWTKRDLGDVSEFAGRSVKLRLSLDHGELYAFWISGDESGRSGGYVAGGGPDYEGLRDLPAKAKFSDGKDMFNRRLGMFIHWGIYSVGGWHEQELWRKGMSRVEYEQYAKRFTGERFDPDHFVDVAVSAGAEYIVLTAKHHDGFCMWNTTTTDYNVMNTPLGRDVVGEVSRACARRGLKFGLYFSNPDWHAPFANNSKSTHQLKLQPGDVPDERRFVKYVKDQIRELCSNYGELCCFFWDIPSGIELREMDEVVRKLQPGIFIDDRGWGNRRFCDYSTPERNYRWDRPVAKNVEACDAIGAQSWGYRVDEDYHTIGYLTRRIDGYLSTGANFLLNVGPQPDGRIPEEAVLRMAEVGKWLAKVKDSYRDVEMVPDMVCKEAKVLVTRRGNSVFLHFTSGINATGVNLRPLAIKPEKAVLLNTGEELSARVEYFPWNFTTPTRETLHVWGIPADSLANESPVIRLDFAEGELR